MLLIDTIAYGAAIGAEKSGLPWASVMPSLIPFPGKGIPPYGLGLKPMGGPLGWLRDKVLFRVVLREYAKAMLPRLNALRASAGLEPVPDPIANLYRPHRILATTGAPLEYARVDTPAHVRSWARSSGTRRSRRRRGWTSRRPVGARHLLDRVSGR